MALVEEIPVNFIALFDKNMIAYFPVVLSHTSLGCVLWWRGMKKWRRSVRGTYGVVYKARDKVECGGRNCINPVMLRKSTVPVYRNKKPGLAYRLQAFQLPPTVLGVVMMDKFGRWPLLMVSVTHTSHASLIIFKSRITTSRPDRIVPIAERFGMDVAAVLDNIIYARAYTYEHQHNLLLGLAEKMAEEPFRFFVISDPAGGVFVTDPKKPAGGHVLAHASTIRLMFRKGKGEQRICKVFDAPNLPEAKARYSILICKVFASNSYLFSIF
ncbi:uncharacterized protein LOC141636810 [Silene latifolia]|uniref:uncharacterized protein LOC141636810 n=1 Tax=Silene latifolia TaxID=37657 RepID=UPI003D77E961